MKQYLSSDYRNYIYEGESSNMAIVVDGIIGAGKSTLASFISEYLELPLYEELKDESSDSLAQRMLDRFYENQERWSAIIQVMFLNDRFRDIKAIEANGNEAILDRSIYGDEIFAKTIHDRGQMTADEFTIYRDLLYNMLQHIRPPELLIYVDVCVDTAMDRINCRARSTEADLIPRDYMEDLRRNYEEWYESFNICPKVRIDFNECCLDENGDLKEDMQEKIISVLKEHLVLK
ncbi:MAG: deoxynucleoside kinase [Firmicutes bacterium]|jgi:deoxyadenosine/deoxycytidine kinase|nr:deoxynucleoside kinase [Bacillota bacterium]